MKPSRLLRLVNTIVRKATSVLWCDISVKQGDTTLTPFFGGGRLYFGNYTVTSTVLRSKQLQQTLIIKFDFQL